MKPLNTSLSKILALTAIVLGGLVVNYLTIAWTGPGATPPSNNTPAPINAGSGSQTKTGDLTVDGNLVVNSAASVDGLLVDGRMHITNGVIQRGGNTITSTSDLGLYSQVSGNWMRFVTNAAPFKFFADNGIGTNQVMTITTNGQVHANEFCDRNGNNCTAASSLGGGGSMECASVRAGGTSSNGGSWGGSFLGSSSGTSYSFSNVASHAQGTFGGSSYKLRVTCNQSNDWVMTGCASQNPTAMGGNYCEVGLVNSSASLNVRCCRI